MCIQNNIPREAFFFRKGRTFFSVHPPWSRTVAGTRETGRGEGRTGEENQGAAGFPVSTRNAQRCHGKLWED